MLLNAAKVEKLHQYVNARICGFQLNILPASQVLSPSYLFSANHHQRENMQQRRASAHPSGNNGYTQDSTSLLYPSETTASTRRPMTTSLIVFNDSLMVFASLHLISLCMRSTDFSNPNKNIDLISSCPSLLQRTTTNRISLFKRTLQPFMILLYTIQVRTCSLRSARRPPLPKVIRPGCPSVPRLLNRYRQSTSKCLPGLE
jgi:hypothetical protein